jgi:hypothetical protein
VDFGQNQAEHGFVSEPSEDIGVAFGSAQRFDRCFRDECPFGPLASYLHEHQHEGEVEAVGALLFPEQSVSEQALAECVRRRLGAIDT